jgi:hypothetical protein
MSLQVNEPTPPALGQLRMRIVEEAISALQKHPESANMSTWVDHDEDVEPLADGIEGYCGTVACLAGHIGLALGLPPTDEVSFKEAEDAPRVRRLNMLKLFDSENKAIRTGRVSTSSRIHVSDFARSVLKLSIYDENRVFTLWGWPYRFRYDYHRAKTAKGRANAMIRRLRYYLETGK